MQRQLNHYMGTAYRNTKYPNPNQTNPLQMLIPQTKLQQKYFYIQISAAQAQNSHQFLEMETDKIKEKDENDICIVVRDKKDGIVVEKQLERHFKNKQTGLALSYHNRRIHTQGDFLEKQTIHYEHRKKNSMKSEYSTENLNKDQGRETPYLRRKRMSEQQINSDSSAGKVKEKSEDKKSSQNSIYSKKKKSKTSQLEFKDIAIVKKIQPHDQQLLQKQQISAISKIFQKRAFRTFSKTQPNKQSITDENQKAKSPEGPPQSRRYTLNTKRANEQDPVFNEKLAAQVKLSKSVFVHSKTKLTHHEQYIKANINSNNNEKGMKLFFFPKHVNKTYKNYYSSHSKKFSSSTAEKREKSQHKKGKSSGKNLPIENSSINKSHRNAGYKRVINTPLKNHQRKAKEQFFNLDGTLENHRLYPEYHDSRAAHNRPLTAKVPNRKTSNQQNEKTEILNYNEIARKCQSANKSKKKRESAHMSNIKPWEMNEQPEDQKNLFDLSFSSIHDNFHVGL